MKEEPQSLRVDMLRRDVRVPDEVPRSESRQARLPHAEAVHTICEDFGGGVEDLGEGERSGDEGVGPADL